MPTAHAPTRPVPELLLELAYHLHATWTVARLPDRPPTPKSEPARPGTGVRPPAPPCFTVS